MYRSRSLWCMPSTEISSTWRTSRRPSRSSPWSSPPWPSPRCNADDVAATVPELSVPAPLVLQPSKNAIANADKLFVFIGTSVKWTVGRVSQPRSRACVEPVTISLQKVWRRIDHALVDVSAQTRSSDRSRRRLRGRLRRRERFARAHAAHDHREQGRQTAHAPSTRRLGISKRRRGVKLSGRENLNLRPFGPETAKAASQTVRMLHKPS